MAPLIKELQDLVAESERSRAGIERKAGVAHDTLLRWFNGHPKSGCTGTRGPSIHMFEAVLNTLGYRLAIVRAE